MRSQYVLVIMALATPTVGYARRAPTPKQVVKPAVAAKKTVALPEWAPKHPSAEFRRAAKVLRPLPEEFVQDLLSSKPAAAAAVAQYKKALPAAWEFFGALTDDQVKKCRATKELLLPVKSLTKPQRAALDRWFEALRGLPQGMSKDDLLVSLYKAGAKEDFSNVDAGFRITGHFVYTKFRITTLEGKSHMGYGMPIATIEE